MTQRVSALAGSILLIAGVALHGCKDIVAVTITPTPAGKIGDPCVPPDENDPRFSGLVVNEENIADRFAACASGICLANHFQGRVSCPLGQVAPASCGGPSDTSCGGAATCAASSPAGPLCDPSAPDKGASQCPSSACDPQRGACSCAMDAQCPAGSACDPDTGQCMRYVCHGGECQTAGASDAENAGKSCCAAGAPVSAAVCGQCALGSGRDAEEAVYCSCRCAPSPGDPPDGSTFCACPSGFECSEIRKDVGLGDASLSGSYCIKAGTAYTGASTCGAMRGNVDPAVCGATP